MVQTEKVSAKDQPKRASRMKQTDVPAYSLSDALRVPRAIHNNYGGDPTKPLDVAAAMDLKPSSSLFRMLAGAAIAYGLTEGGYNAPEISLTPLSQKILKPLEEGAEVSGKREAFGKPRVIAEFLQKYDGSPIPKEGIAKNVLSSMGVPDDRTTAILEMIVEGATALGLVREIKGTKYINLAPTGGYAASNAEPEGEHGSDQQAPSQVHEKIGQQNVDTAPTGSSATTNRKVFITHGKNHAFIVPIRKLLKFGEMEAVVSEEHQTVAKPVPDKVLQDMRSCGAAIIHVDDDIHLLDKGAHEQVVLNSNVLIEIGAAMALYGRRFILLVKEGITLPSNLQGLYEVRYTGESLDGEATIKLLEAINAMKDEPVK